MPTAVVVSIESIAEQELGPFFVTHCNRAIFKLLCQKTQIAMFLYLKKYKNFYFGSISDSVFPFKTSEDALDAGWLLLGLTINVGAAFTNCLCTKAGVRIGVFGWVF